MKYRQAKKIVLSKYPTAVLSDDGEEKTLTEQYWVYEKGEHGQKKSVTKTHNTTSFPHKYYVSVDGVAVMKDVSSPTKAKAWIKVAEKMMELLSHSSAVERVKKFPLWDVYMKREKTKRAMMAKGRKKWYYRGVGAKQTTGGQLGSVGVM